MSLPTSVIAADDPLVVTQEGDAKLADTKQGEAKPNQFWWPQQLNLAPLRAHDPASNPYGAKFNYAEEFKTLDLAAVRTARSSALIRSIAGRITPVLIKPNA